MKGDSAKRFHHQTSVAWRRTGLPPENEWPEEWRKAVFKTYPRLPQVPLLAPIPLQDSLEKLLSGRKTSRSFDAEAYVSFTELSTILSLAAGIRGEDRTDAGSKRSYPSGGRRYPLEIYISAERVEGLAAGVYHYNVRGNSLELLLEEKGCKEFKDALGYAWSKDASLSLLLTSVWDRSLDKYRDFGYKLINLEAGHLTQNLQLVSESLGLCYASLAGFREERMDQLLDLDPDKETSLYLTVIGKPKASNQKTA